MLEFRVTLARAAEKEIARLQQQIKNRVIRAIDLLAENPYRRGSKKLKGSHNGYRFRVGDYRIIYEIFSEDRRVDIAHVRHRREAYD